MEGKAPPHLGLERQVEWARGGNLRGPVLAQWAEWERGTETLRHPGKLPGEIQTPEEV